LATALILTERDAEGEENTPKVKGRIITTLPKAKEVRPFIERCVTIARRSLVHQRAAAELGTDAVRNSDAWREWRKSPRWQEWNQAIAPVVAARRQALQLLGDKKAVRILFDQIAERFADRNGGYTRILHLAAPRLGDASPRAILEFVGQNDRVRKKAPRPSIEPERAAAPRPAVEPEAKAAEPAPASETPAPEA
jgi:large subunit ribosomal protein L17